LCFATQLQKSPRPCGRGRPVIHDLCAPHKRRPPAEDRQLARSRFPSGRPARASPAPPLAPPITDCGTSASRPEQVSVAGGCPHLRFRRLQALGRGLAIEAVHMRRPTSTLAACFQLEAAGSGALRSGVGAAGTAESVEAPTPRRSSTWGMSHEAMNAMRPIGAAMMKTVWIDSA
jgi:hypothetical protein